MNIFNSLFSKFTNVAKTFSQFKMFGYNSTFGSFGRDAYQSTVARSAIRATATNGAKLKPKHVRMVDGKITYVSNSRIEYRLAVRPNRNMNAYDFLYQMISIREMKNNAFALIRYDTKGPDFELYPILYSQVMAIEYLDNIFLRFQLQSGDQLTVSYDEIIHLRKDFYNSDMFGEDNKPILSTLQLLQTIDEGMENAIKSTASLRGILKFQTVLKEKDIIAEQNRFVDNFLNVQNNGGVAAIDKKTDYVELKGEPKFINPVQADYIKNRAFEYYGTNTKIVSSQYDEDGFNAFYESVLEPIAIQLSMECTEKLFSTGEYGHGNRVVYSANRMQYASTSTKIKMVTELMPLGLLTQNEGREVFNLTPVEGGDKRLMSLNYVNADKADQYQAVDQTTTEPIKKEGEEDEIEGQAD